MEKLSLHKIKFKLLIKSILKMEKLSFNYDLYFNLFINKYKYMIIGSITNYQAEYFNPKKMAINIIDITSTFMTFSANGELAASSAA